MTDIFAATRQKFDLPEGLVYLDGNSLGPLPKSVAARVLREITVGWGEKLVRGWNEHGWIDMQLEAGNRIARLIGAPQGSPMHAQEGGTPAQAAGNGAQLNESGSSPTSEVVL